MISVIAEAQTILQMVPLDIQSPLDGVQPSWSVFGGEFESKWASIASGLWMIALACGVIGMLMGGGQWALARAISRDPEGVMAGAQKFKVAAIAFAVTVGINVVVRGLIMLAS